jgi:hypothetical protein
MASAWIEKRKTASGKIRYQVEYRLGGVRALQVRRVVRDAA